MFRRFRHQVLAARFAIFVILLGALMPVLGQALLRASDSARWTEICTTGGMILVDLSADDDTDFPTRDNSERGVCPFCMLHGGHAALLPPATTVVFEALVDGRRQFPELAESAHLRSVWLAAFSRGPPVHA